MAMWSALALLLAVQGCFGIMISKTFSVANICDTPYGITLETSKQRNILACSGLCGRNVSCLSFIYDPVTSTCKTNIAEIPQAFFSCAFMVKYGQQPLPPTTILPSATIPYWNGSYNGDTCTVNTDCVEPLTECRDGICQCLESYVYKYWYHTCVFITALALLLAVQGCFGIMISKTFSVANICDTPYGITLETSKQRNILACSGLCGRNVSCLSFIYDPVTSTCKTNIAEIPQAFFSCAFMVKYGQQPLPPTTILPSATIPYWNGSYNGDTCTVNTDCVEPLTECRDGICQCLESYVYKYWYHTCVFITDCVNNGETFQTILNREHKSEPVEDQLISEADCISLCLTAVNYTCHLISYDRKKMQCLILDFTGLAMNAIVSDYDPEDESIVYQRDCKRYTSTMHNSCGSDDVCYDRLSICLNTSGTCACGVGYTYDKERRTCARDCSLYSNDILQTYMHKTVVGFEADAEKFPIYNPAECRDACNANVDIDCVSAMLHYAASTCYMSNQTLGIYPPGSIQVNSEFVLLQKDCQSMHPPLEKIYCYYSECTAVDSECRDGVCKCIIGFSYKQSSGSCTDVCNSYGRTFQTIYDFSVSGMAMISLPMVTNNIMDECKAACVKERTFQCFMAVLDIQNVKCILYDIPLIDVPTSEHVTETGYVTFQKDCA